MRNFYKKIKIILSGPSVPYEVSILSCSGCVITKKKILSAYTQFCICTKHCKLILVARYGNQTITKYAIVKNCSCPIVFKTFDFVLPTPRLPLLEINLTDFYYGFPIPQAILNFSQQNFELN